MFLLVIKIAVSVRHEIHQTVNAYHITVLDSHQGTYVIIYKLIYVFYVIPLILFYFWMASIWNQNLCYV